MNYGDYKKDGMHAIVVGGYTLSRGLTLEGLMVSYFYRTSVLEDTLLQMGRWFGYRDGYNDLCRIWLTEDALQYYKDTAEDIMELREQFRKMSEAKATPEQFGLKVRSHPGALSMTARNKMGSSEEVTSNVGLHLKLVESTTVHASPSDISHNHGSADKFIFGITEAGIQPEETPSGSGMYGHVLKNVPVPRVLAFIGNFKNHPGSRLSDPQSLREYINSRAATELQLWDVYLPSLTTTNGYSGNIGGLPINCQIRSSTKTETSGIEIPGIQLFGSGSKKVSGTGIEKIGVSAKGIKRAEERLKDIQAKENTTLKEIPDWLYREQREKPLLVVHLIRPVHPVSNEPSSSEPSSRKPLGDEPVIAFSISFPDTATPDETTVYRFNTTGQNEIREQTMEDRDYDDDDE